MTRRVATAGWKRAAMTAVIAYALVLQTVLLAFGGALHAATLQGPEAIICVEGHEAAPEKAPAEAHHLLCCTLSGHGSAPVGPVPDSVALAHLTPVAFALVPTGATPVANDSPHVLPVGSRAPPHFG